MPQPLIALAIAAVLLGLSWAIFRPDSGWYWRWRQQRGASRRVLYEDALKHLHEREYEGRLATRESVAGILGLSTGSASELIDELIEHGFVTPRDGGYVPTREGRHYALQVIRAHRLWERYLADETEVGPAEIHARAEREEHRLSPEEADELDARLGFPTHDPHGDPIPGPAGELAERDGVPLTHWPLEQEGRIVHLEDEPPEVYAQLLAEGLRLGLDVRVSERSAGRVRFHTESDEFVVASVVAENITVAPLPRQRQVEGPWVRLSELEEGQRAAVVGLDPECQGLSRRRFMDLGLTPGSRVEVDRSGPFGDPRAYRVRDTLIALRDEQAAMILVDPLPIAEGVASSSGGDDAR